MEKSRIQMEKSRIRDPVWKKVGSGIRDKHPGSATLKNIELSHAGGTPETFSLSLPGTNTLQGWQPFLKLHAPTLAIIVQLNSLPHKIEGTFFGLDVKI
jgi:hypothetical protein